MTVTLDKATMECIGLFQGITNADVKDCIIESSQVIYVVDEGQIGSAIGKGGVNVQKVRSNLGKNIRVCEYNSDPKKFIKNLLGAVKPHEINIKNNTAFITLSPEDKGSVVGKDGKNIKTLTKILERQYNIRNITIKTKSVI
ncbi:NusA-like transcription termination signal-binding factor [Candidatus Undinarchaeota archaeon]